MSRLDQYNVSVSIDGTQLGTFDKLTGGELDSEETKYKPGAMAPQITLGGSTTVGNVVVSRLFDLDRDLPKIPFLKSRVGKGTVTISVQSLSVDGDIKGSPRVYTGKLKTLKFPEPDSEATTSAAMLELTVSSGGSIS
jgi:hypothetical protein